MITKGVILCCVIALTQAMFFPPKPFPPKFHKFMPRPIVQKKFIPIIKPVEVKVPHRVPVYIEREVKVPVYIEKEVPVAVGGGAIAGAGAGAVAGAVAGGSGLDLGIQTSISDADHVSINVGGVDVGSSGIDGSVAGATAGASAGAISNFNDNGFNDFNNNFNDNTFNDFNNNGFNADGDFLDSGIQGVLGGPRGRIVGGGVQDQFIQQPHSVPTHPANHGAKLPIIPAAKDVPHF